MVMPRSSHRWLLPLVFVASINTLYLQAQTGAPSAPPAASPLIVGSLRCASCHQREHTAWQSSQHARALQPALADTVLGNFKDATFDKDGVISTFRQRGETFFVDTEGPDGKRGEFEVKFTLGVA